MNTTITRRTELAHRASGGVDVYLFWNEPTSRVTVGDARGDDSFEFEVDGRYALDAFNHPYAYNHQSKEDQPCTHGSIAPALTVPGALKALQRVGNAVKQADIPETTLYLVELRASQINGCGVCVDIHSRELKHAGEPDERINTVAVWRDVSYFTEPERAALALTEAATRLADRPDPVPDDVWDNAAHHYDSPQLAALVLAIAAINTGIASTSPRGRSAETGWASGLPKAGATERQPDPSGFDSSSCQVWRAAPACAARHRVGAG